MKIVSVKLCKGRIKEDKKSLTKTNFKINDVLFHFEDFYNKYKENFYKIENTFLISQIKKVDINELFNKNEENGLEEIDIMINCFEDFHVEYSPTKNEIETTFRFVVDHFIHKMKQLDFNKPQFPLSFSKKLLLKDNFQPENVKVNKKKDQLDLKILNKSKNSGKAMNSKFSSEFSFKNDLIRQEGI
jgi:hypothetical protein